MNAKELSALEKESFTAHCDCGHEQHFDCAGEAGLIVTQCCGSCGGVITGRLGPETNQPTQKRLSKTYRRLFAGIADVFARIGEAMTVRGVYYRMEAAGYVGKTEAAYKQVQRALYIGRWRGIVSFDLVMDESRFAFEQQSFNGISEALDHISRTYRRALWADQRINLQIWIEKLALASIVLPVTREFNVPLMPCRGYNSLSYLQQATDNIKRSEFPTIIYHFGDYDPSGVQAGEAMEDQLTLLGAGNFHFERVAINADQVERWNLPTRPTKKSDPRAKSWAGGDSCDLDALEPARLRQLVRGVIERHIDPRSLEQTMRAEQAERATLAQLQSYLP